MMNNQDTHQPIDLREHLQVLQRHKWLILLMALLGIGSALFLSSRETPLYRSQSRVLVEAIPTSPNSVALPPNLETESQLMKSLPVAELVIDELGLSETSNQLIAHLTVSPIPLSAVLEVSYLAPDPERSASIANGFAENYLEYRRESALEKLLAAQDALRQRVSSIQTQLNQLAAEIDEATLANDEAQLAILDSRRTAFIARLGVLQQRLDDVQPDRTVRLGGGQVIETAAVPAHASSPNHRTSGILGAIFGLMLGVGLSLLRERLDNRFRGRDDIERALEIPVLITVPRFKAAKRGAFAGLPLLSDPGGSASEAYRSFRTSVQFIANQKRAKSILITSAVANEGKTITTANLAISLAQAGSRVVIVSADLRKPTVEQLFGAQNRHGLANLLMSTPEPSALNRAILDVGLPNLRILPSGPIPPNPAEILTSRRLVDLIRDLENTFDFVLVDSPPVLPVADAAILSSRVGGTVLVVDAEGTERTVVVHSKQELERVGARMLGVVLNGLEPGSTRYRYYEPYRYYSKAGDAYGEGTAFVASNGNGTDHAIIERQKRKRSLRKRARKH